VTDPETISRKKGWLTSRPSFLFLLFNLICLGCGQLENKRLIEYQGAIREAHDIELYYTEEDTLSLRLTAGQLKEFKNGDRDFQDNVFIEFFHNGTVTSTLSASQAYYFKATNKWRVQGNVELRSLQQREQLNTEELFWFPGGRRISTDKFVTVKSGTELIYGTGLDAAQDLSEYQIRRVEGEFEVDEQP